MVVIWATSIGAGDGGGSWGPGVVSLAVRARRCFWRGQAAEIERRAGGVRRDPSVG